jgi:protease I
MELREQKVALLVDNHYQEHEFWYPYYRLQEAGADVEVLARKEGVYESKHGLEVEASKGVADASPRHYQGIVIPGGYAPDLMRRSETLTRFVAEADSADRIIAAICHAGWVPISANIVDGRKLTSYHAIRDDLVNAGANWVDREVVRDGNLITSRKPADLPAFLSAIIEAL